VGRVLFSFPLLLRWIPFSSPVKSIKQRLELDWVCRTACHSKGTGKTLVGLSSNSCSTKSRYEPLGLG
jgi:hypothetical protein